MLALAWGAGAAVVLAGVFLLSAITKLASPAAWRAQAVGLGVPAPLAAPVPFGEAVLGAWLLVQWHRPLYVDGGRGAGGLHRPPGGPPGPGSTAAVCLLRRLEHDAHRPRPRRPQRRVPRAGGVRRPGLTRYTTPSSTSWKASIRASSRHTS